jgi:hypothetical protein
MATEIICERDQPITDFIPFPGHIKGDKPILEANYHIDILQPELDVVTYNEDLLSLIQPLDENMYLGFLENITAFGPRVTTTQGCVDAGDYIYNQFDSMGLDPEYHYWEDGGLWGNNIIGTLEGNDQTSDEIYIICGHYDTVSGTVGADDNGAGTSAVLAAAYIMRNAEFNHTIRFIGFSGEEQGLYGSYYYAQDAAQNGDNIIAVLNLDMIGYIETPDDAKKLIVFDDEDESIWITDFIDSIAVEYFDIFDLDIIHGGWSWGSDHFYFWEFGFHAIFGHEYQFNPHWHQPSDIIDNMDISYATRITQLMIVSLAELSGFITYNAPYIPDIPDGPVNGKVGEEYTYTSQTTDPQGDEIFYLFNWGDGTDSGWLGPYSSGEVVSASHTWNEDNTFQVKVKAKDTNDYESEFSDFLSVVIPRNKIRFTFLSFLLERISQIFPIISKLLQ